MLRAVLQIPKFDGLIVNLAADGADTAAVAQVGAILTDGLA